MGYIMHEFEIQMTAEDHVILESYKTLLDGLADYLGSGYELVLHSLENLDHSAVKVINGFHTGRKEGAPITELALQMLQRINSQGGQDFITYHSVNSAGKPLRSATMAIRGKNKRIIGLLCINFYLDTPLSELLQLLSGSQHAVQETYVQNNDEMIQKAVQRAAWRADSEGFAGTALRNKAIIHILYEEGIFNVKDAVQRVADELQISKNTVYLHLRHCKESKA